VKKLPLAAALAGAVTVAVAVAQPTVVATGTDPERDGASGPLPLAAAHQMYIMTDKPLYRPGETIWFRAWEVDASLAPAAGSHAVIARLVDPRGNVAVEKRVQVTSGDVVNDFALATDLAGGRYVVRLISDTGISEDRAVTVSTYEVPRLKPTLEFGRRGYAPGDRVTAVLTVVRATGEVARGAKVSGRVVVDGVEVAKPSATVGRSGTVTLRFTLPATIAGDGLLTAVITDGGASESIQRRIPINTGVVAIGFYPEGGDLIAGLPSTVYFAATSPTGEPVDVKGRLVDDTGAEVGAFASAFRGRGTFALTPAAGRRYSAIVDAPATGAAPLAMPAVRDRGCVLGVPDGAATASAEIDATVTCSIQQDVTVVAALRGKQLGTATAKSVGPQQPARVRLPLTGTAQGAVRVTVLDANSTPVAERLVYRKLGTGLSIRVQPDREGYAPREQVKLTIETLDAVGGPVATDVAVAVVDDAVLSLADDRTARIQARLYLEPEMPGQTIADPNFYFSADKQAPVAMDLLLGTQGWRRFRAAE
jgi:alpha-2-macroglobulin-like protein